MWKDLLALFYPRQCLACGRNLKSYEQTLCIHCLFHLPKTRDHENAQNRICEIFAGKVRIEGGSAFLYFTKSGKVQHLIHQLKYQHCPEVGYLLGEMYGDSLRLSDFGKKVDAIVPVPLHPKKERKRGYNQSEVIAKGISASLKKPLLLQHLVRTKYTETQTRKSSEERRKNVATVFSVIKADELQGKHLLLVDDVITTGATLESCLRELLKIPGVKVSIACLAAPLN